MATYRIECTHCRETSFMTTRPPTPVGGDRVVPRPALRCCPCCGRSDRMRVFVQARRPADYHDHVRSVWHADRLPIPGQAWRRIQQDIQRSTPPVAK
ncbi:MAG: hypothetical protein QOD77_923 [Thermoplasmata archaeon]|jgi:hypothetical protein|nr:hypothetical protein [Thermoplasmata archaeon]